MGSVFPTVASASGKRNSFPLGQREHLDNASYFLMGSECAYNAFLGRGFLIPGPQMLVISVSELLLFAPIPDKHRSLIVLPPQGELNTDMSLLNSSPYLKVQNQMDP